MGDYDGFEDLFREQFAGLVQQAYLLVGDREMARDLAQEAFARAYARWSKVGHYDKPGAWVRRVMIRMATRSVRVRARQAQALRLLTPGVEHQNPSDPDLLHALLRLPMRQRVAVVLHYLDDMPLAEVAHTMSCAESTAKVHLHRGRLRLAELLGEDADA